MLVAGFFLGILLALLVVGSALHLVSSDGTRVTALPDGTRVTSLSLEASLL